MIKTKCSCGAEFHVNSDKYDADEKAFVKWMEYHRGCLQILDTDKCTSTGMHEAKKNLED